MPFKKMGKGRQARLTTYFRKGRRIVGRVPRPIRRKKLALQVHGFNERYPSSLLPVVQEADAANTANGLFRAWNFSGVNNSSSYKDIFAMYKINKVIVTFRYKGGTAQPPGASGNRPNEVNPVLYIKRDHDDDQLTSGGNKETLAQLKESSKTFEIQLTNNKPSFTMAIKPAILKDDDQYYGSLGVQHVPVWNQWLNTKEDGIAHMGLKAYAIAAKASSADSLGSIEVTQMVYFQCKGNE